MVLIQQQINEVLYKVIAIKLTQLIQYIIEYLLIQMSGDKIIAYCRYIFQRENIHSTKDIIQWWNKGRKWLNIIFIIYFLLYVLFVFLLLRNGFIGIIWPLFFILLLVFNIIFSVGIIFELFARKTLKLNVNYDKICPVVKGVEYFAIVLIIVYISVLFYIPA